MPKPCVVTRNCRWENGYFFNFSEISLTLEKLVHVWGADQYSEATRWEQTRQRHLSTMARTSNRVKPAFSSELSKWAILIASAPKREQYLTRPGSFKQSIDKKSQTHDCWEALRCWSVNDKWELQRVKNYTLYWLQVELLFGLCTLEVF